MHKTFIAAVAALLLPAAAPAQNAPRPDPLDAKAATAPLVYRSAFSGYKKLAAESPPLAWREANDAALRIGGWRAYAREAQQADVAPATQAADSPPAAMPAAAASAPAATEKAKPMPPGHGGHKMP